MGFLKKFVNATEWGECPVCGQPAGWGARNRTWVCLNSGGAHNGVVSTDGRLLSTPEYLEETMIPDPAARNLDQEYNEHLLSEAVERFGPSLRDGITVRLEVGQAVGLTAAWGRRRRDDRPALLGR